MFTRFALSLGLIVFLTAPATAGQFTQKVPTFQQQRVDSSGRILVAAAFIRPFACITDATENRRSFYLYEYTDTQGRPRTDVPRFRVIAPPNYGAAIGGHDWSSWEQALNYACHVGMATAPNPGTGNISGTWQLSSDCTWVQGGWKSTLVLSEAANGALTGSSPDPLKLEIPPASGSMWGSTVVSRLVNPTMTLVMHPGGWVSVLEFTGTLSNPNTITGRIHHYTSDDCNFTMARAR